MSAFDQLRQAEREFREAQARFENGSGRPLSELLRAQAELGTVRQKLYQAQYAASLAEDQARVREAA